MIEVEPSFTTETLRAIVASLTSLPLDSLHLFVGDTKLEDGKTLESYMITNLATVTAISTASNTPAAIPSAPSSSSATAPHVPLQQGTASVISAVPSAPTPSESTMIRTSSR